MKEKLLEQQKQLKGLEKQMYVNIWDQLQAQVDKII